MLRLSSAALLAGTVLFTIGCSRHSPSSAETIEQTPIEVATARVEQASVARFQAVPGTVRAVERATVSAQVMGTIRTANLAVGAFVSAGDVLITISADQISAQVDQARAALDLATNDHEREARLLDQGASTAQLVSALADRQRIAEAALAQAEAQLAYTRVTAPFTGVITQRHVEPGDFAGPGAPLFAIEGRSAFEVEVAVPDSLPFVAVGESVEIRISDQHIMGLVREASPAADPTTRTRLVRIALARDAGVRSGQYARAQWPVGSHEVLSVPTSAVSLFGQLRRVFVVAEGRTVLRLVKTGAESNGHTVILAGLSAGEIIVLDPPASLREGQPLNPAS